MRICKCDSSASLHLLTCRLFVAACFVFDSLAQDCTLYTYDCQGGMWFVVVNRHPTKYLSITVDCSGSTGLLSSRGRNAYKIQDHVPPRQRQLLLVLVTPRSDSGYSYARTCSILHVDGVSGNMNHPKLRAGYDVHKPMPIDVSQLR
jgi:hypothetical protein